MNQQPDKDFFKYLYSGFEMPLSEVDCGLKCGPHNDYGVPICCDINLVIPAAFELEWSYLRENTDLWQPWSPSGLIDQELEEEVQDGQVLLKCQGYQACQRPFRTLTCRAFPFYPYLSGEGEFLGLAYYHDFREVCWIISNLAFVSAEYKMAFQRTFKMVFKTFPESRKNYLEYCRCIRQEAASRGDQIVLLNFSGGGGLVDPVSEQVSPTEFQDLKAFGPYAVARELPFPDELQHHQENEIDGSCSSDDK